MDNRIKTLNDLIKTSDNPGQGLEIPWNDPDFSRRILKDQLNPDNDIASRRPGAINKHVQFIHHHLLGGKRTTVLDLGCGPGLYSHRLAKLGQHCTGIDYSPAAIEYARQFATENKLNCTFILADFMNTNLGNDYGLVMLTFGDFNALSRKDGKTLIQKVFNSLCPGGLFLIEGLTLDGIIEIGERESSWMTVESGIFSDNPYLFLDKYIFKKTDNLAFAHYFIINSEDSVDHYQQRYYGYSDDEYQDELMEAGFDSVEFYPGFGAGSHDFADDLQMIVARK